MRIRNAVVVGLLAVALAGCGKADSGGDGVASAGGPKTSQSTEPVAKGDGKDPFLKFAQCMREHGVDMPDPDANGNVVVDGTAVGREKMEAADKACKKELPDGGEMGKMPAEYINKMREHSKCMRENGLPKYPDPREDGSVVHDTNDVDPRSPEYEAARKACQSKMPTMEEAGTGGGSFSGSVSDPSMNAGG